MKRNFWRIGQRRPAAFGKLAVGLATAIALLGNVLSCTRSHGGASELDHHAGEISSDLRAPWMWNQVSDETFAKLLNQPILPADAPIVQRLNTWIFAIDKRLRERYPDRLQGIPTPEVAVISGGVNAFVTAIPVCIKDRVVVRDVTVYRLLKQLNADSHDNDGPQKASRLLIGTNTVGETDNEKPCLVEQTVSDQEIDERIALFNRVLGTDSNCRFGREGEVIFLKDSGGGYCTERRFSSFMPLVTYQPVFMAIPNRVTFLAELLQKFDEPAVISVMSHELGHYYGAHMLGLDPDFNRFYAPETRGSRSDSKPAFGGADDTNPHIRDAWNFDHTFGAFALDQVGATGSSIELLVANSTMLSALDKKGLSHYDYPAVGQPFSLDLARLLLNAVAMAPSLMTAADQSSHEPLCKQLMAKYLAPQTSLYTFLFDGARDTNTVTAAAASINALWQESTGCLTGSLANANSFVGVLTNYSTFYDLNRLAWEGGSKVVANTSDTKTVYPNIANIATTWQTGKFGRQSDSVDPQTLKANLIDLSFTMDPSDMPMDASDEQKDAYQRMVQSFETVIHLLRGTVWDTTYLQLQKNNSRQLQARWDLADRGRALTQQFNALQERTHLARYTMEDAADELAMEFLTLIGQPTSDYAAMARDLMAITDEMSAKIATTDAPAPQPQLGDCLALQAAGWQTLPHWGSLNDPHASGCWRLYTLDREMAAHHYVPDSDPVAPFGLGDAGWTDAISAMGPALDKIKKLPSTHPASLGSPTSCLTVPQAFPTVNSAPVCLDSMHYLID